MINNKIFNPLIGTFFLCLGLLVYEIFSTRLLSIVVGPHMVIIVIAFAMLGMSTATSFMSLAEWPHRNSVKCRELSLLCILLGLSYLTAILFSTLLNNHFNIEFTISMTHGGLTSLVETLRDSILLRCVLYGCLLFIPYFVFGIAIAVLFKSASALDYHKIYFSDLLGAAVGCFLCVLSFQYGGYPFVFALILSATFLAALFFAPKKSKILITISLILFAQSLVIAFNPSMLKFFEPEPEQSQLARDYNKTHDVLQHWHSWNSYSRVALLSISKDGQKQYLYALDNGEGWANVPYNSSEINKTNKNRFRKLQQPQPALAAMFDPKNILVIFAGVGDDMVIIDRICQGKCKITGVEINDKMVNHALDQKEFDLQNFFNQPHINLVIAEGREYLERDSNKYESILLSWSGASIANYVGTSGQTTQFLYTKEAFESLLDHLAHDGILILSNTSKAQALLIFRRIFEERNWGSLSNSAVILKPNINQYKTYTEEITAWDTGWDENRLIISPSGFDKNRLKKIRETAANCGYYVIIAPDYTDPAYFPYRQIIENDNLKPFISKLIKEKGIEFSVISDDRPYILDFTPRFLFFNPSLWFSFSGMNKRNIGYRVVKIMLYIFLLGLTAVAIVLIFGPLILKSGPRPKLRNINHLIYFFCLGSGFMLVEVGLIHKLGLFLGNPGYSISVVLATLILATGLGSYFSKSLFTTRKLTFRKAVFYILVYLIFLMSGFDIFAKMILPLMIGIKVGIIVITLFPLGFLMGQLFPQGLVKVEKEDSSLVPWAWAINGASSTVAVCLGLLMSQPMGFRFITYAGAIFYAMILALPEYRKTTT